jgi:hypothetical protein
MDNSREITEGATAAARATEVRPSLSLARRREVVKEESVGCLETASATASSCSSLTRSIRARCAGSSCRVTVFLPTLDPTNREGTVRTTMKEPSGRRDTEADTGSDSRASTASGASAAASASAAARAAARAASAASRRAASILSLRRGPSRRDERGARSSR